MSDRDARELLTVNGKPGDFSGVEYPYHDPARPHWRWTSRIRLDSPPTDPAGKPSGKYRSPYGDRRHLYFPPGCAEALTDTAIPIVFIEAEKSALALTAAAQRAGRPILAVALGGCWNWRGRIGTAHDANGKPVDENGPLPDFDRLTLQDRSAIVLFDARPTGSVEQARRQFAQFLCGRGAIVTHAQLPDEDRHVNGPDDLIAAHGDAALWRVLDAAVPHDFIRDKNKRVIESSLDNIRLALARLRLRLRPTFDTFKRELRINGAAVDDAMLNQIWIDIDDRFHWRPSRDTLRAVIDSEAHRAPIHPVREYLDGLTWDRTPRLDTWLVTYGGASDTPDVRAVGSLPLIAAVRRVRRPGCKFDELLTLESLQGELKSSALQALWPDSEWFSDDLPLGVDSKLVIERTGGKWIIEAGELHGNPGARWKR